MVKLSGTNRSFVKLHFNVLFVVLWLLAELFSFFHTNSFNHNECDSVENLFDFSQFLQLILDHGEFILSATSHYRQQQRSSTSHDHMGRECKKPSSEGHYDKPH